MDDQNIKNAKKAADLALLQNKAKDFQDRSVALQNKIFTGTYQGVTIVMKGSHDIIEVRIDQSFYETSGKGQMEIAIMRCLTNLNNAVNNEIQQLQQEMQRELAEFQKENGTY